MGVLSLLGWLINWFAETFSRNSLRELDRLEVLYRRMSDEQLRAEFRRHIAARRPVAGRDLPGSRWLLKQRDTSELHALAVAVCMFDRYPCDLPAGSRLYDEQRLAALMLLDQLNVQMDTGEGKTYAIAVASVALLARYPQVIVVTANAYLAKRDHARVSSFYASVAVECIAELPPAEFEGIAYVTLDDVCFGYLQRTYGYNRRAYPGKAAVVVDEIDSVLLDQSGNRQLVRHLRSQETLWEEIYQLVEHWGEEQYTYNPVWDTITLSAEAWEQVARLSDTIGRPAALLMDLAAGLLWAMRAKPGADYIVDGRQILLINRVTGQPYAADEPNQAALVYLRLGGNPYLTLATAKIDGMTLLARHPHVVGLSGTVHEDTLYYAQQLGTMTGTIPPRFPRFRGEVRTLISPTREKTLEYVQARIEEVAPRPVVVGAWSAAEARAVAEWLRRADSVDQTRLSVVTSFDSETDAATIDNAGAPGAITVLSQGGSRGVDVRSVHRPLLIVLGRALEPRLDRQFLGRVGRHGEEFDAEFVADPESPVWIKSMGVGARLANQAIPLNRAAARGLRTAQRDTWLARSSQRQRASVLSRAVGQAEVETAARFVSLKRIGSPAEFAQHAEDLAAEQSAVAENIQRALQRRRASDDIITDFEAAIQAVDVADQSTYQLTTTSTGDSGETRALTRWLRQGAERFGGDPEAPAAVLFRRQAALAAQQRLPIETAPQWRGPADIERETRLILNASFLTQLTHKLDTLWVSAGPVTYYRRGAFAVDTLHKLAEQKARTEVLNNLLMADRPAALDELFYIEDHNIIIGPTTPAPVTALPPPTAPRAAPPADEQVESLVQDFLTRQEKTMGGLPLPPDYSRVLLVNVIQPLLARSGKVGGAAMRRQVNLTLDALAATGTSAADLRRHRRLIVEFTDDLFAKGVLTEPMPAEGSVAGAWRRVRSFVRTIPVYGVAAAFAFLVVAAIGLLPVVQPARHFRVIDYAANLFGLGSVLPDRPLMSYFALLVVGQLLVRALGIGDPATAVVRLSPLISLVFAFLQYSHGLANLGSTLLIWLLLLLWTSPLLLLYRFVIVFIGADLIVVLAGCSVIVFVADALANGTAPGHTMILVGVAAALAGPAIAVSVESQEYVAGKLRHADNGVSTRVAIDTANLSGVLAFAVTALANLHGNRAFGGFVVLQLVAVLLIANQRLGVDRVEAMFARMRVGSPFSHGRLRGHLRRVRLRTFAVAAVILGAATVPVWLVGGASTIALLLDQWAGVVLATGILACGNAFSVGGRAAQLRDAAENDDGRPLRKLLQSWRRTRLSWVWRAAVVIVVLIRPLQWLASATDLVDAAKTVWHVVTGLFGQ